VPGTGAEPASREEVDDILFADYRTATKPEVAAALVLAARHGIPMYDLPETLYDATARVLDVGFQNYAPAIPEVDLIDKIADWYADEEEEPPEDVVDLVRSALKVLSEHDALNHASAVRWLTDPAGTEVLVVDTVDDGGEHYIDGPFLDAETATKRMREKGYQYPNQVTPEIASEIVGQARAIASSAE
jgi:hypothetical protein